MGKAQINLEYRRLNYQFSSKTYPLYLNSAQYRDSRVGERWHYGLRNANPGVRCELR
jgi:hypothetical protein